MIILAILLFVISLALATYNFTRLPKTLLGFWYQYLNFHVVIGSGLLVALLLSKRF